MLAEAKLRPALLNFAHGYNCGGGFEHSGGSQEEDIFRKSSVFLSLWPHRRSDDGPNVLKRGPWIGDFDDRFPRKDPFYEIARCGGIYSPHARACLDYPQDPALVQELPRFAVLTAAAQNVNWDPPFDPGLLHQKIRTVLHMAAVAGHDSLVLGAFGCGYFRNRPEVVAQTFAGLLLDGGEFAKAFRLVVFAIPTGFGKGNFNTFSKIFPLWTQNDVLVLAQQIVGNSQS